ncbi:hypothetical protein OC846_002661 [Tilletia horrida]|uniref:Uncharacterized protein n=1 Tax=Tilletia horrida TaxID=155126 RepID=A0AAN6GQC9_9BASI|nr:hypothetical protein OC846_002661 [Tilletia horrida]
MAASLLPVQDRPSQSDPIAEDQVTKVTSAFLSSYIAEDRRASTIKHDTVPGDDTGLPNGATSTLSALLRGAGDAAQLSPMDAESNILASKAETSAATPDALALAQKIASMLRPGPPFFSEMDNAALVGYIGNAQVMNGDQAAAAQSQILTAAVTSDDPTSKQSVWAALDSLPIGAGWAQIPNSLAAQPPSEEEGFFSVKASPAYDGDDGLWSALMLTCDLPSLKSMMTASDSQGQSSGTAEVDTSGLNVQLGQSVVIPTSVLKKTRFYLGHQEALGRSIFVGQRPTEGDVPYYPWDDFSSSTPPLRASTAELFDMVALWTWPSWIPFLGKPKASAPPSNKPGPPVGQKRVWVPSRTKVSIYATWWGYRLYLPPPVMKSLTEDLGTAESIAKVLSTVLSFIITHIPLSAIPPQLIPLVTVLQAIAPLTGYLATFIAWAWSGISAMDKGDGIVLSATWILPVAIIPKAWDAPIVPADGSNGTAPPPSQGTTPAVPVAPAPAPAPAPTPAPAQPLPSGSSPAPLPIGLPSAQAT